MKKVAVITLLCTLALPALAYNPVTARPTVQYEPIPIEGDTYLEHDFLGTLKDYPHMYEFKTDVAMTFTASVLQSTLGTAVPFGLIFVRQNDTDGGVTEVVRDIVPVSDLKRVRETGLGITLLRGSTIRKDIGPGIYRLEVSTPDNRGDYMLVVGEEPMPRSYFRTLIDIVKIQHHFGYTPFHLPLSSYIYYPTAILGLLLLLGLRYRKRYLQKNKQYVRFTH